MRIIYAFMIAAGILPYFFPIPANEMFEIRCISVIAATALGSLIAFILAGFARAVQKENSLELACMRTPGFSETYVTAVGDESGMDYRFFSRDEQKRLHAEKICQNHQTAVIECNKPCVPTWRKTWEETDRSTLFGRWVYIPSQRNVCHYLTIPTGTLTLAYSAKS